VFLVPGSMFLVLLFRVLTFSCSTFAGAAFRRPAFRVPGTAWLAVAVLLASSGATPVAASEHVGQVTFNGLPVPGTTVTASQGERRIATTTDQQGIYRFADLSDGSWSISVQMLGFAPVTRDVAVGAESTPAIWELMLLSFEEIARTIPTRSQSAETGTVEARSSSVAAASSAQRNNPGSFQRAEVNATTPRAAARTVPDEAPADSGNASDGFLINGSVNNGAASPFAQPAAFGNNRRRAGALYNGSFGVLAGNSAWDARPYSFADRPSPPQDYSDVHVLGLFQGPLKIPGITQRRPNLFAGYQRTSDHNATTQSTIVPTALERAGDFSQTVDAFGRAVQVIDPLTGRPFAQNAIPTNRISPQAAALLHYYPQANLSPGGRFNYQAPLVSARRQDSLQTRVTQPLNQRNSLLGLASYQRTTTDTTSLLGFEDEMMVSTLDTTVTWTHRINQFFSMRPRVQFTQVTNETTPFFANRVNVSGDAGIVGNNQDPINWGPPSLVFSSGIESLTDARAGFTRNRNEGAGGDVYLSRGRHFLTLGGDLRRQSITIRAQQDPRGRFSFTGATSGWDLADFVLGIPHTTSIAFGNADKLFHAWSSDAYLTDDWRVSPSLTLNLGVRWEYESPITERFGRLVNLDVTSRFAAAAPVLASNPTGSLTNTQYDRSLLAPDNLGIQPRLAAAWRPIPGSSLLVRAGYGIYRNPAVYQPIATLLAQQPPLSRTFSIENSVVPPLTLANAFTVSAPGTLNTFAVDPDFRVGSVHNWQVSAQRDLPQSLTVTATYLGTHGAHLMQEFLPNSYAPGLTNPCPTCPLGFVYLTSDGTSSRHAAQLQVRRRLSSGLTWTTQYTLAKAEDDATAFIGASLSGNAIAQNWLDLDAEWGPSSFDQRHLVTAQVDYTTGVGVRGGGLLTGKKGALLKGWTISSQLTAGSGFPLSPIYMTSVPGTGVIGTIRADLTGAPVDAAPSGYYLNPAAYAVPSSGHWGTAGRNSVRGPAQFGLNAALTRSFPWGNRVNMDWRVDALNVLNSVTYSSINALVGTPQFGLPTTANTMRKLQTSLRVRF
jgi:hypothetical protein